MPKTKWCGAEEPKSNNVYKIYNSKVCIFSQVRINRSQPRYFISTANTPWQQVSPRTHLCPPADTHASGIIN